MVSPDGKLGDRSGSSKRKSGYNKWNAEESLSGILQKAIVSNLLDQRDPCHVQVCANCLKFLHEISLPHTTLAYKIIVFIVFYKNFLAGLDSNGSQL